MTSSPQHLPRRPPEPVAGLARLNAPSDDEALAALREVCAGTAWARGMLARRPYADLPALLAADDAAMAELTADDLAEATAGHPPIGRPKASDPVSSREQSGMTGASDGLRAEMADLNLTYRRRFGHVFLVCAAGLTGEQLRDALRARLGNTPEREREIVRTELGRINRIRLTRLIAGAQPEARPAGADRADGRAGPHGPRPDGGPRRGTRRHMSSTEPVASVSTHILDTSAGRPAAGVAVSLSALGGPGAPWTPLGDFLTDADGRCAGLPALPPGTVRARLVFGAQEYFASAGRTAGPHDGGAGAFFPEVTVTFAVGPGEHHHVPLLLNPFGYSVYRGS